MADFLPHKKRKTADLIPYARNARTHSDEQVAQIAASIKEFGFTNPVIIDSKNTILAGHGRIMAAQKLGMDEVPCIEATDWTDAQKQAYIIADNKLALNAGWDNELLSIEIMDLSNQGFDLELLGFSEIEFDEFLDNINFEPGSEDEQGKLDELEPKMVNCPHCNKDFDSRGREV